MTIALTPSSPATERSRIRFATIALTHNSPATERSEIRFVTIALAPRLAGY